MVALFFNYLMIVFRQSSFHTRFQLNELKKKKVIGSMVLNVFNFGEISQFAPTQNCSPIIRFSKTFSPLPFILSSSVLWQMNSRAHVGYNIFFMISNYDTIVLEASALHEKYSYLSNRHALTESHYLLDYVGLLSVGITFY